jgi:glycosyltransferase involved in cell wall biosynthesis
MARMPWLFYPDYRASNPYQALLGAALSPAFDVDAATIDGALRHHRPDQTVFHLHWEDAIYLRAASHADAETGIGNFLETLAAFQARGGRCVWTVHNAAPHENRFPDLSSRFHQALAARADLVHVHGTTAATMVEACGAVADTILVLPHPHFRDAYPDDISDTAARRYFGFDEATVVFAFFGVMRAYKGLDTLADAFARLHRTHPDAGLVLAGRPASTAELDRLVMGLGNACRGARILPRFIDDCLIQYVMRAADYVVLPYRNVLTSGAMTLALGFARPVIVPCIPALMDVVTQGHDCIAFDPQDDEGLYRAFEHACTIQRSHRLQMGRNAKLTAEATSFAQLGRALTWWARDTPARKASAAA